MDGMGSGRTLRLTAAGVRLDVDAAGPEDGPPVILLHGFPDTRLGWGRQIAPLAAAGLRVLAPDQRGYAGSGKPPEIDAYRIDRLAADVFALADDQGWERFSLVGHDWGGVVAWWAALERPERIARLAVLNAPHPATLAGAALRDPVQALRSWYIGMFQLPGLPERLFAARDFRLPAAVLARGSRPGSFDAAVLAAYRRAWAVPRAVPAMLNWYRALRRRPPLPAERVTMPALLLWGLRDRYLGRRLADSALALCDDAEIVRFPDCGHWLHREEPERVNRALVEFLKP